MSWIIFEIEMADAGLVCLISDFLIVINKLQGVEYSFSCFTTQNKSVITVLRLEPTVTFFCDSSRKNDYYLLAHVYD